MSGREKGEEKERKTGQEEALAVVVVCGQLPSWRATITSTREGSSTPVANTLTQAFPRTQEEEEEAEDGKMRRKEHE